MGSQYPFEQDEALSDHVKNLDDEELLDLWVEAQTVQQLMEDAESAGLPPLPDMEQAIVHELQLRRAQP